MSSIISRCAWLPPMRTTSDATGARISAHLPKILFGEGARGAADRRHDRARRKLALRAPRLEIGEARSSAAQSPAIAANSAMWTSANEFPAFGNQRPA